MKQTNRKADLPLLLLAVVLIFLIVCPVGMIFAKAVIYTPQSADGKATVAAEQFELNL